VNPFIYWGCEQSLRKPQILLNLMKGKSKLPGGEVSTQLTCRQ